jgi:glycosyltransferase involved in cell wall biosynthesis
MADFSAVIITRNEALHIKECIVSLKKITDDVVVVDSGSTDNTIALAQAAGARIYNYPFQGFGANKNYGNSQAKYDWIISLDGDEVLSPQLTDSILKLEPDISSVYALNSLVNYCGQWIRHSGWYPRYKNRIFNKKECQWDMALVHEDLTPLNEKTIVKLKGDLLHYSYLSYAEHLEKSHIYGRLKAEEWIRKTESPNLLKRLAGPYFTFIKSYFLKFGFLDGKAGFNIAKMNYLQYVTAINHYKSES